MAYIPSQGGSYFVLSWGLFFFWGGIHFFFFFAFVHALLLAFSFIRFVFMDIDLS